MKIGEKMEKLYTVEEVADYLRVAKMTVYRWIYSGKLKSTKIAELHRISEKDIEDFITSSEK